jgi:hypothetical protein
MKALLDPIASSPPNSLDRLSGSIFAYEYRHLEALCSSETLADYTQQTRRLFAPVAKSFDDTKNTEWALRSYLALKLILHATIMATSARYANDRNLQVALPYLSYYTLFSACRAFLLTCPDVSWTGANTARFSHSQARTLATDLLRRLDAKVSKDASDRLLAARRQRELSSYSFPMSGPRSDETAFISTEDAIAWAGIFAELAHLNSACLEGAVAKHCVGRSFGLNDNEAWDLMEHPLEGGEVHFDEGDWAWLSRLFRDHTAPVALTALVTEGLTEDFFEAWSDHDDTEGAYNPDDNWRVLLDVW